MDEALQNFLALSGTDDINVARFFLESAGNDVNQALNAFLDSGTFKKGSKRIATQDLVDDEDDLLVSRPKKRAVQPCSSKICMLVLIWL
jgi:hypothetical protein